MPQKSFLPPNICETLSESTNKQMIIEPNKKVKLNNPTPYSSRSKTKPNPTLGKPTPAPQLFINIQRMNLVMTWIPQTPQVQYQPLSKLPVMTHTTPSVLIA